MRFLKLLFTFLALMCLQNLCARPMHRMMGEGGKYTPSMSKAAGQKHSVVRNTDSEEWVSMGTGRFRDDFITRLYVVDCYEFDVEIQQSLTTPGLYRVVSPYRNYIWSSALPMPEEDTYMVIDATDPDYVFFDEYNTGYAMDEDEGCLVISSMAGYDLTHGGDVEGDKANGIFGTLRDGQITFGENTLLVRPESFSDESWYIANMNEGFRVLLPGAPDLDMTLGINGLSETDPTRLSVNITIGADCQTVKLALVPGDYSEEMYQAVVDGTVASQEVTESGEVLIPFEEDGVYTLLAVPYLDGTPRRPTYVTRELNLLNKDWKKWGYCTYTEGIICDSEVPLDGITFETYQVELEEKVDVPGYYRLVDPYGPNYRYSDSNSYDYTRTWYMEIDASDPECVSIKEMAGGCGWNFGAGKMEIWSKADRELRNGKTKEEVKGMGYFGKRVNGVITMPIKSILVRYVDFRPDTYYWANLSGMFKVVLPQDAVAGVEPITDAGNRNAGKEYFTIDGMKVDPSAVKAGVYVVRQNGKTRKVVIK